MTMSFYHLSLQRYYSVQVTIRFYKREFDYIDIYNMDVVKKKAQGLEVRRAVFQSCSAVWTWRSCLTPLGLSLFICQVCCWTRSPYAPPTFLMDPQMEAHCGNVKAKDAALKQTGQVLELEYNHLSSGRDFLSTGSLSLIKGHLFVIYEKSNFQMIVLE